MALHNKTI